MDYTKAHRGASGVAKAGLATGITGAALGTLGVLSNGGGGILGALLGGPRAVSEQVVFQGGYVTEKELSLVRESSGKDSIIAQLQAEKYADTAIKSEVEPLKTRVCDLETKAAVNAARDHDFRLYVEREFIHQPKASIRESIVVCRHCGCKCECDCQTEG